MWLTAFLLNKLTVILKKLTFAHKKSGKCFVEKNFMDFESKSKSGILPFLATSRCGGGVPARVLKLVEGFKTAMEEAK